MKRLTWVSVTAAAVVAACSSSTGPTATLAGTWHVQVDNGSLTSGAVQPDTFSVTVTKAGTGYTVSMPSVAWGNGGTPILFDSGASAAAFSDTSTFGFGAYPYNRSQVCQFIQFQGTKNRGLDTLTMATVAVFNSDTEVGGYCPAMVLGTVSIHK
jgi:hypothetical protein